MKIGEIGFIQNKKIFFIISLCLVAVTLLATMIFGVNLDISFKGGTIITYGFTGDLDADTFQKAVESQLGQDVNLQEQTNVTTGDLNYVVSLTSSDGLTLDEQGALEDALLAQFEENNLQTVSINNVHPTMGREFFTKCLVAVALAAVLMVVYIAFRFRRIGGWSAGVFCVVALMHDLMIVYLTFVLFGYSINENFIAVMLTILGYSINATIVIYDRIRENRRRYGTKMEVGELVNKSINQSLMRTVNTTIATALAMVIVCIVAVTRNVSSIMSFAVPMLIGVIAGLYSSVCLSGPLWVTWQRYKRDRKQAANN